MIEVLVPSRTLFLPFQKMSAGNSFGYGPSLYHAGSIKDRGNQELKSKEIWVCLLSKKEVKGVVHEYEKGR